MPRPNNNAFGKVSSLQSSFGGGPTSNRPPVFIPPLPILPLFTVTLTAVGLNQINITWTPRTRLPRNVVITYTLIRIDRSTGIQTTVYTGPSQSFSDTTVSPGPLYCYTLITSAVGYLSGENGEVCLSINAPSNLFDTLLINATDSFLINSQNDLIRIN
jgi:hypothetical protein